MKISLNSPPVLKKSINYWQYVDLSSNYNNAMFDGRQQGKKSNNILKPLNLHTDTPGEERELIDPSE